MAGTAGMAVWEVQCMVVWGVQCMMDMGVIMVSEEWVIQMIRIVFREEWKQELKVFILKPQFSVAKTRVVLVCSFISYCGSNINCIATFQIIESIVGAFGGFAQMLESTFMATHSSFFGMLPSSLLRVFARRYIFHGC